MMKQMALQIDDFVVPLAELEPVPHPGASAQNAAKRLKRKGGGVDGTAKRGIRGGKLLKLLGLALTFIVHDPVSGVDLVRSAAGPIRIRAGSLEENGESNP